MKYSDVYRQMNKEAGLGQALANGAYLIAAVTMLTPAVGGAAAGYAAGKLTTPGIQDVQNLQKQHRLARLKRDNETQRLLQQREDTNAAYSKKVKPMRFA